MTTPSIRRLAIVNRGEAAMRCIRAVKQLNAREGAVLRTIALFTDVDRDAPFVRHADEAVLLPGRGSAVASYLDHDLLLGVLRRARADAVWPGWGFVAEDPRFVDRLAEAGIVFLGPSGDTMRRLGDKIAAKLLAEEAEVPVAAWSGGEVADEAAAIAAAEAIGYPLVIKATAGGGGRGIRVVDSQDQIAAAFRSATQEAKSAFGDGRVFLERKVIGGRHVEIQIAGDRHGKVVAVGARDCSVQRRHQKVIEEGPPPGIAPERIGEIMASAVRLAESVGYVGVGTVEFLVTADQVCFLEVNPRLQVEHGITEAVTGVDLVEWQIRIARGEHLPDPPPTRGYAIEARVCAEDPDAGFLPAPGIVQRFNAPLGAGVRVDTGVVLGSRVPPDFDSLIAKVIVAAPNREEACGRLISELRDFELVVEGGATNKGYLIEVLEDPEFRAGGIDTGWLDRWTNERPARDALALPALAVAAILAYQRARLDLRRNFFAEASATGASRVPPSIGQRVDLSYRGEQYRLQVYAVGGWKYRIQLDGQTMSVVLREEGQHGARLVFGGRFYRVLHDMTDADLRVEVDGRSYRFGRQTAGQVSAGTPAVVVAVHVKPGDRVESGQPLGLLEAMKMEIGFTAPVAGTVKEVLVQKGRQVAAGDVLLVIDPGDAREGAAGADSRLAFRDEADPLDLFFSKGPEGEVVDLLAAESAGEDARRAALDAVREEIRRSLLGYDADPEQGERLAAFLEARIPDGLSEAFRRELAEVRHEIAVYSDVERLFVRTPQVGASGAPAPSNNARLRMFVRRIRAGGAGIADEFLAFLEKALRHYGTRDLEHSDALERAILRLFASQTTPILRRRLVMGLIRRVVSLARSGVDMAADSSLSKTLALVNRLRGTVPDGVADAAVEADYLIFEKPEIDARAERTTQQVEAWLQAAERDPDSLPGDILLQVAESPRTVFDRVGRWISADDPRRRVVAVAAHLRRLYTPLAPATVPPDLDVTAGCERLELEDGRSILGAVASAADLCDEAVRLASVARRASVGRADAVIDAIELFVPPGETVDDALVETLIGRAFPDGLPARRFTLTLLRSEGGARHRSFVTAGDGRIQERLDLQGLHPETARRIDLDRLRNFELERIDGGEGIYCFHGRSRAVKGDERVFVIAEVRGRAEGPEASRYIPVFERAFYEATRTLRGILALRDPGRRLRWNRVTIVVWPEVVLDPKIAETLARRLAPATRHLGLEKIVVRVSLLAGRGIPGPGKTIEVVLSDLSGSRIEIQWREPHKDPLRPASDYERKVVEARRRGLVYPYEIVRMLTGRDRETGEASATLSSELPVGTFEEYDLDPAAPSPAAVSVAGRPYGGNRSSVVFGILSTPTAKVPEGMRRVLVLSDPTRDMGALAKPECDRLVAAIDLAEREGLPVEWVPVSSGARIAMDSGTENLDATARVVRRIVTFTNAGGVIHLIVYGVNVGAQSYFDALATMGLHTKGVLVMTPQASMVLTGRAALEASGSVAAEDEVAIGGFERIMGPNGEAQYYAPDLGDAFWTLYQHYAYTYVVPGESRPRSQPTRDAYDRDVTATPTEPETDHDYKLLGEIFDDRTNPGRRRPFSMRALMAGVIDEDGGHLERWRSWVGAETAIVWDAHLGGHPVCLVGIESRNVTREGFRPPDGPSSWNGGTLFPLSSKKVSRALNAASANRPAVILANLSGFDGSPESMRKLQLEYGAEIARAVVNFRGPIFFVVVSRYHGGAYVVFSRTLNDQLHASALTGAFASVIGGAPAAAVVFSREVRSRALAHPAVVERRREVEARPSTERREAYERVLAEATLEEQAKVAAEFDAIHTVTRALEVGSLERILEPRELRAYLVREIARAIGAADPRSEPAEESSSGNGGAPASSPPVS